MIRLPDCVAIGGGAAGLGGVIEDSLPEPKGTRGLSAADRAPVRTARELGREVATGKDARAIYSIGTQYHGTEEALAQLGLRPTGTAAGATCPYDGRRKRLVPAIWRHTTLAAPGSR